MIEVTDYPFIIKVERLVDPGITGKKEYCNFYHKVFFRIIRIFYN